MKAMCAVCGKEFEKTHEAAVLCGYPDCFRRHTEDVRRLAMSEASKHHAANPQKARCAVCGKEFEKTATNAKTCGKDCRAQLRREYQHNRYAAHPEKFREHQRKYRAANLEKYRELMRRYRAANREKAPRPKEAK